MADEQPRPAVAGPLDQPVGRLEPEREELARLRKRVKAQRAELRRLNKMLGPYWAGFRSGLSYDAAKDLRVRMFAAFGSEAVLRAEHARCNCVGNRSGQTTGGWWCPLHGHQL